MNRRKKNRKNEKEVWHFETANLQALCKPVNPLMDSGFPVSNATPSPKYVTCRKCRNIMVEQGIIQPEDIDKFEK